MNLFSSSYILALQLLCMTCAVASNASSCNLARQSWSSRFRFISTTIILYEEQSTTYIIPKNTTPYTTLCDGIPRAHGSALWKYVTNTSSYTSHITTISANAPLAPCSLDCGDCSKLWGTWFQDMSSNKPACASDAYISGCNTAGSITCNAATKHVGGATAGPTCVFGGGPVQLAYWPVITSPGNLSTLCGGHHITMAQNSTEMRSAVLFNTTITSPSMYVYFSTLYAVDGCGETVGTPMSSFLLPVRSKDVSTACGWYNAGLGPVGPLDFADLNSPVPWSAYSCMPQCGVGGRAATDHCSTMYDDYLPQLAFPDVVTDIQSAWSGCGFSIYGNLLYDPPIPLSPMSTMAQATSHYNPVTSTAALPASATTVPAETTYTSTAAANTESNLQSQPASSSPGNTATAASGSTQGDPVSQHYMPTSSVIVSTSTYSSAVVEDPTMQTSATYGVGSQSNGAAVTSSLLEPSPVVSSGTPMISSTRGTSTATDFRDPSAPGQTQVSFTEIVSDSPTDTSADPSTTNASQVGSDDPAGDTIATSPAANSMSQSAQTWGIPGADSLDPTSPTTDQESTALTFVTASAESTGTNEQPTSNGSDVEDPGESTATESAIPVVSSEVVLTTDQSGSSFRVTYLVTHSAHASGSGVKTEANGATKLPFMTIITTVESISTYTLRVPVDQTSTTATSTKKSGATSVRRGCLQSWMPVLVALTCLFCS